MRLGVTLPNAELGADPGALREFAQAVEELGYNHLLVNDHVVGADPSYYKGWRGAYTHRDLVHEPFVLFGYLAAVTRRLELVTSIIILPQRQAALVAKQAAEADVLSGGRLRLGIGAGWNPVEYEALGQDFHNRGRRIEEQITLMRALWTQEVVTFQGRWERVTAAGINPLPVQRPIPIWIGGGAEAVLRRVGRLADGWIPPVRPDAEGRQCLERVWGYAREAGRDPASIGVEGRIAARDAATGDLARLAKAWRELGATHLSLNPSGAGLRTLGELTEALRRFKEAAQG